MQNTYSNGEYSIATHYALQLTRNASLGIGFKFLSSHSDDIIDQYNNITPTKTISGIAAVLSYYQIAELDRYGSKIEWGAAIKNFGPAKQQGSGTLYMPTNLGIGFAYTHADPGTGDRFIASFDINKYGISTPGGKSPDVSIFQSLYSSFSDAAEGFSEELQEIRIKAGLEYGFVNQFFLRGGIAYEAQSKGNRQYFGLGAGYRGNITDQSFCVNVHYLIPFSYTGVSPFQNCYGITLKLGIGNFD